MVCQQNDIQRSVRVKRGWHTNPVSQILSYKCDGLVHGFPCIINLVHVSHKSGYLLSILFTDCCMKSFFDNLRGCKGFHRNKCHYTRETKQQPRIAVLPRILFREFMQCIPFRESMQDTNWVYLCSSTFNCLGRVGFGFLFDSYLAILRNAGVFARV